MTEKTAAELALVLARPDEEAPSDAEVDATIAVALSAIGEVKPS